MFLVYPLATLSTKNYFWASILDNSLFWEHCVHVAANPPVRQQTLTKSYKSDEDWLAHKVMFRLIFFSSCF